MYHDIKFDEKGERKMYNLKAKDFASNDAEILLLHSEWLESDGQYKKAKECRQQATGFKQRTDWRQAEGFSGRRRHERQVKKQS